jgi:hypothetical protein
MNWRCFFKHDWQILREVNNFWPHLTLNDIEINLFNSLGINHLVEPGIKNTRTIYLNSNAKDKICRRCETTSFKLDDVLEDYIQRAVKRKKRDEEDNVREQKAVKLRHMRRLASS